METGGGTGGPSVRIRSGFWLVGVLALAAGCGSHGEPDARRPALSSTPTPTAYGMVASPLDPYLLSNTEEQTLLKAQDMLARDCLARFGITTTHPVLPRVGMNSLMRERNRRTFVEPKDARRYGYHRSASFPQPGRTPVPAGQEAHLSAEAMVVLNGWHQAGANAPRTYDGRPVPEYGCRGQAKNELIRGVPVPEKVVKAPESTGVRGTQSYVAVLRRQAVDQLIKDDRYHDVMKRWSACMKRSGHVYANPGAAMRDRRWKTPQPTRAEIDTAVADTRCRLEQNYLGVIGALRAAYEQRVLNDNRQVLSAIRTYLDRVLGNATKVIDTRPERPPA